MEMSIGNAVGFVIYTVFVLGFEYYVGPFRKAVAWVTGKKWVRFLAKKG